MGFTWCLLGFSGVKPCKTKGRCLFGWVGWLRVGVFVLVSDFILKFEVCYWDVFFRFIVFFFCNFCCCWRFGECF